MSKTAPVFILASLVLTAAFTFAALEFRRMGSSFATLEERVAKVEAATPAGAENASRPADGTAGSTATAGTSLHEDVVKLREEIARLRAEGAGEAEAGTPVADTDTPEPGRAKKPVDKDELARAVTDALAAKEKADKERQAKLYRKQMEQSAKNWAATLAKKLGLTETQKQQVAEIFADYWSRMSTGWNGTATDENAEVPDYQKLNTEMTEKVKALMTPEQAATYDEMMKKNNWWGGDGDEDSNAK